MIGALLCGLFFGALAVWERWARADRERRADEILETLPSDEDDWPDPPLDAYEDRGSVPFPTHSTLVISPNAPGITIDGVPLDIWRQQFEPTSGERAYQTHLVGEGWVDG